jgi:hypothetical protein
MIKQELIKQQLIELIDIKNKHFKTELESLKYFVFSQGKNYSEYGQSK